MLHRPALAANDACAQKDREDDTRLCFIPKGGPFIQHDALARRERHIAEKFAAGSFRPADFNGQVHVGHFIPFAVPVWLSGLLTRDTITVLPVKRAPQNNPCYEGEATVSINAFAHYSQSNNPH